MTDQRSQSSFEANRRAIVQDHRLLGDLLTQLQRAPHPTNASRLLGDLRGLLSRHFEREQGPDGLFEMIRERAPQHGETITALTREHQAFLSDLEDLTTSEERQARDSFPDQVVEFVTRLREHESRESKLLLDSLAP